MVTFNINLIIFLWFIAHCLWTVNNTNSGRLSHKNWCFFCNSACFVSTWELCLSQNIFKLFLPVNAIIMVLANYARKTKNVINKSFRRQNLFKLTWITIAKYLSNLCYKKSDKIFQDCNNCSVKFCCISPKVFIVHYKLIRNGQKNPNGKKGV